MTVPELLLVVLGIGLGGVLKGATGAGAPVVGVPVVSLVASVPVAVALFTIPNLATNLWQGWRFRHGQISRRFTWVFALSGAAGAGIGSLLLAFLPGDTLMGVVAIVTLLYIAFRLARPDWQLGRPAAEWLGAPVGLVGGILQGAGGISAPVSLTFLNAMRLERPQFIATISVFFAMMSVVQIPALAALGILTPMRAAISLGALIPLFGGMALGGWLARHLSRAVFDRLTLALLALVALKLMHSAFF